MRILDWLLRRPAAEPEPQPEFFPNEVIFEAPTGGPCKVCGFHWSYFEDRICEGCYRQAELRWQEEDQL